MIFLNLFDRLIKKKDVYFKYSNEEQFTGEYNYDGKKIYCISKTFTTSSSNVTSWTDVGLVINNLYRVIDISGYGDDGTQFITVPRYESSSFYLLITFYSIKRGLTYKSVGYPSKKITVIVKYTKTTD